MGGNSQIDLSANQHACISRILKRLPRTGKKAPEANLLISSVFARRDQLLLQTERQGVCHQHQFVDEEAE